MKLESVNDSIFKIAGISYTKGDYVPVWKNLNYTNSVVDDDKAVPTVNVINKNTNLGIFNDYVSFTRFVDSVGTPYTDAETFALALATIISGNVTSVGPTGPTGPQGPVGPAGLTWRGAWVSGTSYLVNDAVGYSGASYFCIANTSGTTTPNLATTAWALLASQGAVGPAGATGATGATGAQGPQGIQGPAGSVVAKTTSSINASDVSPYPLLTSDFNFVGSSAASPLQKVTLPTTTATIGKEVTVYNFGAYPVVVRALNSGIGYIFANGFGDYVPQEITVYPGQAFQFTYIATNQWACYFSPAKLEYGSYVAKIITADVPVVNVIKNTLNTTVTVSRETTSLKLVLGSGIAMTDTNTYISASNYTAAGQFLMFHPERTANDIMYLRSKNLSGNDSLLYGGEVYVELRVYNFFY